MAISATITAATAAGASHFSSGDTSALRHVAACASGMNNSRIATIGASAQFSHVADNLPLLAVGALWMVFHAVAMIGVRRILGAPVFFLAVGSQANVGGAASAPVVAAAFHPALATVGVLLAVLGYVLGTYVGIIDAFVLQQIARWYGG